MLPIALFASSRESDCAVGLLARFCAAPMPSLPPAAVPFSSSKLAADLAALSLELEIMP